MADPNPQQPPRKCARCRMLDRTNPSTDDDNDDDYKFLCEPCTQIVATEERCGLCGEHAYEINYMPFPRYCPGANKPTMPICGYCLTRMYRCDVFGSTCANYFAETPVVRGHWICPTCQAAGVSHCDSCAALAPAKN